MDSRDSDIDFIEVVNQSHQESSRPGSVQEYEGDIENHDRVNENEGLHTERIGCDGLAGNIELEFGGVVDRFGLGQSGVPGPSGLGGGSDKPCSSSSKPGQSGSSGVVNNRKHRPNMTELIELLDKSRLKM